MKTIALAVLFFVVGPVAAAQAQTAEEEVMAVVQRLFDGMRAADTTTIRSVFHPEARLVTTGEQDGTPMARVIPIDRFIAQIGQPHDEVYDERIWDPQVHVDDNFAMVWMQYAFYLDDEFSHCGVNAAQLVRGEDGWKIIEIADTRRQEGCESVRE